MIFTEESGNTSAVDTSISDPLLSVNSVVTSTPKKQTQSTSDLCKYLPLR